MCPEEGRCLGEIPSQEMGRQGHLVDGEGRGPGPAAEERGASVLLSLETPSLLSLFSCVQGSLCPSPGTDVVCSGYVVVRQKRHPVQACLCWVMWSTWGLCGSPGNAVPYQEPAVLRVALPALGASSFGWIAGPPGWVLLSQACPYSPSTCGFSQPCIVHSCGVPGGEGRGGGWLSRHFWGVLSSWNLFRSLTLVFIRLSLKASD